MPNWSDWDRDIKVVRAVEDPSTPQSDLETLRKIFVPLSAALAETAPRSQLFHDLAACQVKGECSPLRYDPAVGKFVFTKNGKERTLDPDLFTERGFLVCKSKDTQDVYIRFGKPVKGQLAVSYEGVTCDPGDEPLGTVHLHPAGAVFPSGMDMLFFLLYKYNCIAGKVYDPSSKKEYARVLCAVTDDVFRHEWTDVERKQGVVSLRSLISEFPEVYQMEQEYDTLVHRHISSYDYYMLRVIDAQGNRYDYIFPPRAAGALRELVRKAKEVFSDTHRIELYTVDLSESKPPSLSKLEK